MYRIILVIILLVSIGLLFFENASAITGYATQGSTSSEVTIQSFLSIQMSDNLSSGIIFDDVNTLPATNVNASRNYNGTGSSTLYYINVSTDGNSAVDFCIRADGGLNTTGGDLIGLGNETYSNNVTTSNSSVPELNEVAMTTSFVKSANAISVGAANYYRFWLDVPSGQPTGTYNNSVFFKGVTAGNSC